MVKHEPTADKNQFDNEDPALFEEEKSEDVEDHEKKILTRKKLEQLLEEKRLQDTLDDYSEYYADEEYDDENED